MIRVYDLLFLRKLNINFLLLSFIVSCARLGVVATDAPTFEVQQPEHVHRLHLIALGPRRARRGRPTGAVPASGQGVYPAFETRTGRPGGADEERKFR